MTDDEIKLAVTLSGDATWACHEDPYSVESDVLRPSKTIDEWDNEASDNVTLWFTLDEVTSFLRFKCRWLDLSPHPQELKRWLPLLAQEHIKLCDLTPDAWGRIIQAQTIQKLKDACR